MDTQNPGVTPDDVEACIATEIYFTAMDGLAGSLEVGQTHDVSPDTPPFFEALNLLTFCVLVTRNGHTVTGEAHCQNRAKFDAETGRQEARKDAIRKLWPMVVYARRCVQATKKGGA